mmetsp:Transcript_39658/g.114445  ORF Transcript_39658/g.114445 Transcript_39658/m.114445 type:complete len:325 (-) Transcript_39658:123-1097(-)
MPAQSVVGGDAALLCGGPLLPGGHLRNPGQGSLQRWHWLRACCPPTRACEWPRGAEGDHGPQRAMARELLAAGMAAFGPRRTDLALVPDAPLVPAVRRLAGHLRNGLHDARSRGETAAGAEDRGPARCLAAVARVRKRLGEATAEKGVSTAVQSWRRPAVLLRAGAGPALLLRGGAGRRVPGDSWAVVRGLEATHSARWRGRARGSPARRTLPGALGGRPARDHVEGGGVRQPARGRRAARQLQAGRAALPPALQGRQRGAQPGTPKLGGCADRLCLRRRVLGGRRGARWGRSREGLPGLPGELPRAGSASSSAHAGCVHGGRL